MHICFLLLNALFEVVTKIIQCMFLYTCPCMYSTINISGCIILSSDICGFFCKVIVVVACVVSKSLDALVELVIFLDFDFMYVYLFPALECTV